ncbi:DNA repair protein endonuclease SAE2/CtIP C-terminus-domain-containing protein [Trametes punicea]|nr:DNA repair protein endonuclease SAE2/CtIP C-terminus-domain-containing protein [Trametes punicea]
MPKDPSVAASRTSGREVQLLENKINRLRWINDDLNKQVFEAVQRGHRLAAKLGYQNLEEAELALATQPRDEAQSQFEQLSQYPTDELASHVQDLQSELVSHVQLSKSTLAALEDALQEMTALREENLALQRELQTLIETKTKAETDRFSTDATEVDYLRTELAALKKQYVDLRKAKDESERKHTEDYKQWREFKIWLTTENEREAERVRKRRRLSPPDGDKGQKENTGRESPHLPPSHEWEARFGHAKRKLLTRRRAMAVSPAGSSSSVPSSSRRSPTILASRNLNSPPRAAPLPPASSAAASASGRPQEDVDHQPTIPSPQDDAPASSETELETQTVTFFYPSQHNVTAGPSTIPQKRSRSPAHDQSSSETEFESQAPTFIYPSQIIPEQPASTSDTTPKPRPTVQRIGQLWTPVSATRPQQASKGKSKASKPTSGTSPPASVAGDPFLPGVRTPSPQETRPPSLPETPISPRKRKGKGRMIQEDKENGDGNENAAPTTASSTFGRGTPQDYSVFKGRGRYGDELEAGKETINALYELDPARNEGAGFQYEEVVRDKQRRKHMHAVDCECCHDYYEAVGPLPPLPQGPLWRSPHSTPSKRRRSESFADDEKTAAAIEEHKQAISRHRQRWDRAKTPPGYWSIGFPTTQEVEAINAEAARMHEEKRAMIAKEAERGGRYKRR